MKNGMVMELVEHYCPATDITFITKDWYKNDNIISSECVGWYHGTPNERDTKQFVGKLKAICE